ncbi:hypothetical protein Pcinc_020639 [Petrolisthes cinctipes]|uniref:RNA-directed DNA polymerase n=1 Tax=Petrolisthes cinctipes TaxID=88211 RepID=A0AAE1KIV3_PETCI|nr:hypothetical protein Pcinc_020639 [Petrolisthes cinctipes]
MEKQMEALTALLVRQAEAAQRAQEEGQRREERLNQLLEHMVAQPSSQSTSRTGSDDTSSSSNTSTHSARFPASAATTPHLTSSASLREFDAWRYKFEGYVTLTKINMLTRTEQRAALTAVLDDEWTRTLRYGISVPEDADLGSILDAMGEYLRNQRNIIVDRRDFYLRVQEAGESFDDFLCSVKEIANFCEFCDKCVDSQLRDRIVVGTSDELALKRMLENKNLTLENAIDICRASESANHCSAVIRGASHSSTHVVNKVSGYRKSRKRDNAKTVKMKSTLCFRCGKDCRNDEQGCRAVDKVCRNCGKRGHFAVVCRHTDRKGSFTQSRNRSASPRWGGGAKVYQLLAGVYTKQVTARPAPRVVVRATHPAGRDSITWTPDSGAETTVMGFDTAASLGIQTSWLKPAGRESLYAAGNHPLTCLGTFPSRLELGSRQAETVVSVVKEIKGALLSWYDSIALGILPKNFPAQIRPLQGQSNSNSTKLIPTPPPKTTSTSTEVVNWPYTYDPTPQQRAEHAAAVIKAFPRVFGKDDMLREMVGGPMHIELTDDARPFSVTAPRIIPYSWREEIKQQLDDLLDKGIIEKVDYPTSWCHPIVPVPKKPSGVRLCVDLTRLNRYVKRPVYPVRSPHDAIASVGPEAAWFTTLDAKMGYFQIKMAEEDQDLTCFITPWGSWKKGSLHCAPDALSRAPVQDPVECDDTGADPEIDPLHAAVISSLHATSEEGIRLAPLKDQTLEKVRAAAERDTEYTMLKDIIINGFPEHRHELDHRLRAYWPVRSLLATDDDFIVYGPRLLIPLSLRRETLERLHDGHQGMERTKRRARQTIYWPGIDRDIENIVSGCSRCRPLLPSHPNEPLWQDSDRPERVFESVSADYFHVAGRTYLVYIDRLSGWPHVTACLRHASADHLIRVLRSVFADTGVPVILRTDGGPQFTSSSVRRFLARWGVEHRVSSPHNPRANGHAEAAVKAVKKLVMTTTERGQLDEDEFARGLLELRNTPKADGRSPAQILFGHPMRSCIPAHHRSFSPQWQLAADNCDAKADHLREQAKIRHDSSARSLPLLHLGGYVDVQDHANGRWDRVGVIVGIGQRRDYLVKMGSGRILWRNRRFLRPHRPMTPVGVKGQDTHHTITPQQPDPEEHHNLELPQRRGSRQRREPQRLKVQWHASTYD